MPRSGSPDAASDSPYIDYEAVIWDECFIVVSNGTHTRPIFERLKAGNAPRDAVASVLMGLDRELTSTIPPAFMVSSSVASDSLWLGSITANSVAVVPITVTAGQMAYATTYEYPLPSSSQFDAAFDPQQAAEICRHVVKGLIFAGFDKPICAAAAVAQEGGVEVATLNVE